MTNDLLGVKSREKIINFKFGGLEQIQILHLWAKSHRTFSAFKIHYQFINIFFLKWPWLTFSILALKVSPRTFKSSFPISTWLQINLNSWCIKYPQDTKFIIIEMFFKLSSKAAYLFSSILSLQIYYTNTCFYRTSFSLLPSCLLLWFNMA